MFHSSVSDSPFFPGFRRGAGEGMFPLPLIGVPLLIGILLGSVLGLFGTISSELSVDMTVAGFFPALMRAGCFLIAALLLATSFLGFALIPALSALRGFLLGCGVAAAFQTQGLRGLLLAFFSFGIPALFGLPAFLLASSDSAECSRRLLRCFSRGEVRPPASGGDIPRHILLVALLCLTEALYTAFLLPLILGAFS